MDGQRILKILVIEERPEYQDIFRAGLSGMGQVRLLFAPSFKVGIVALKKTPFDLLLLRGEISAANNHALIRAIRADAKYDKLAVIVVYPRCGTDEARAALDAGATSCLTAQPDPQTVRAAVLEALRAEGQVQPKLGRAAGAAVPAPSAVRGPSDPRKAAASAQGGAGSAAGASGSPGSSGPSILPGSSGSAPSAASPTLPGVPDPIDDDEDARRLVHSGEELLARRLFTKAAQVFLAVLKRKPLSADAFSGLAESFSGLGDAVQTFKFRHKAVSALAVEGRMAEAGKAARRMGEAPAGLPEPLEDPFLIAGRQLQEGGQLDRAVSAYEAGLERSAATGETGELRKELAVAYLRQGKEKKAVRTLTDGGLDVAVLESARKAMRAQEARDRAGAGAETGAGAGKSARNTPGVQQDAPVADWKEKRQYPRIPLVDFSVSLGRQDEVFIVVDISMGGICFKVEPGVLEPGQVFRFNLLDSQDVRLKKVQAVVRFAGADRVGCQFLELSDTQRAALEELISQEQKKAEESDDVVVEDVAGIRRDPSGKIIIEVDW